MTETNWFQRALRFFKDQPSVGDVHVASASSEAAGKKPKRKPKTFADVMEKFDLATD